MARQTFRRFDAARPGVADFYRTNHREQTLEFVLAKKREYLALDKRTMGMWEALELLEGLVDDSDPDLEQSQIAHALQTAEAIRADGHPRWLVAAGLVHDAGKVLALFGEPQWAVVGDTFPVGCAFSPRIVHSDFFDDNPDLGEARYQTRFGIYEPGCGFDRLHLSWGHDEYLYHVVRDCLPDEALYMIRYHSFYAAHHEGEYAAFMDERDREWTPKVRAFSGYDLYSKSPEPADRAATGAYYRELVEEFFPRPLRW
jgi:inositol oxygenase